MARLIVADRDYVMGKYKLHKLKDVGGPLPANSAGQSLLFTLPAAIRSRSSSPKRSRSTFLSITVSWTEGAHPPLEGLTDRL